VTTQWGIEAPEPQDALPLRSVRAARSDRGDALRPLAAFAAPPANVEHVETFRGIAQYRLKSNGMTILLAPDRNSPVFTFMVVYHVGSRNEAPGNTGSAHLLEHMIFNKSTENFGKATATRRSRTCSTRPAPTTRRRT
jgi:hypothetical protein